MPVYEYKCSQCKKVTSFAEKMNQAGREPLLFWKRKKCSLCGCRKLERVYSSFYAKKTESMADTFNEMSKLGPVNFVPRSPVMPGPPPGGCPYCQPESKGKETSKK